MARSTYFDLGRSADACPGSESGYAQRFQCGNIVKRRIWTRMPDYRVKDEKTGLSELEAHILTSIDHVWLVRISLVSRCCERDAELWLKGTRGKCALSNHRPHSEGGFGPDQFGRNTHGILCRVSRGTHVARSGCWDLPTLLRHDRWARYRCEE